jgi:hypothetical protein
VQRRRAQEAADVIGAEGGRGALHLQILLGVMPRERGASSNP